MAIISRRNYIQVPPNFPGGFKGAKPPVARLPPIRQGLRPHDKRPHFYSCRLMIKLKGKSPHVENAEGVQL